MMAVAVYGVRFQLRIVLLMCTCYLAVQSSPTKNRDVLGIHHVQTRNVRICGPELREMLSDLCGGTYNSMRKRDNLDTIVKDDDPFVPREFAFAVLKRSYSRTRGPYNECCLKSCSINEMLGYCGRRPTLTAV